MENQTEDKPEPQYICANWEICEIKDKCVHSVPHTFTDGACDGECTRSGIGGVCIPADSLTLNDYIFFSRLISLTTKTHQELEALSDLRNKVQDEGKDIQFIDTIGPMLSDLQILNTSIDVIAKLVNDKLGAKDHE